MAQDETFQDRPFHTAETAHGAKPATPWQDHGELLVQALLNARDKYHEAAKAMLPHLKTAAKVWVTEAVFLEVAAALSAINRAGAAAFIRQCYQTANITVVSVDTVLLNRALDLYSTRADKAWSLTDCISFVVMRDEGLTEALTADHHFAQAGFQPLLTP